MIISRTTFRPSYRRYSADGHFSQTTLSLPKNSSALLVIRTCRQDRMCKCNTVTRDDIPFAIWSGLRPDTPHQCVRAQCGFRFSSASSPTRSLTFGRWGCGERCHLSHVVGDPGVVLLGMSRQIAPQTRSKALRRTKRVLDARQGMEGAKNAYRGSQEVKRADTPNQGLSGR